MKYFILLFFVFFSINVGFSIKGNISLPYLKEGNTRFTFSQMYLSLGLSSIPKAGSIPTLTEESFSYKGSVMPRFTVGATHFWGHADFYVSFFLSQNYQKEGDTDIVFNRGVETGAMFYPWRLEPNKVRPFIGLSWLIYNYEQNRGNELGPRVNSHRFPLLYGLSYPFSFGILELGGGWLNNNKINYALSKTLKKNVSLPNTYYWFNYKFLFDTTIGLSKKENYDFSNVSEVTDAWMISIGPSSAFQTSRSSFNNANRPYLNEDAGTSLFPEFGLGYYMNKWDSAMNLSYRTITFQENAYGTTQERKRRSVSLEFYKFLFDYHGFVPYVGLTLNQETLSVKDTESNLSLTDTVYKPGLIFGWDIRPTRYPIFLLRTNMRYITNNKLTTKSNGSFSFDHFEFNFIQFVLYPERLFKRI